MESVWDAETITEGYRALDLFVDRQGTCRRFLGVLNDDPPRRRVLYLHGDGGNGKSLLLQHLRQQLCKRFPPDDWAYLTDLPIDDCLSQALAAEGATAVPSARLDFARGPRDPFEALLKLRRDLSDSDLRFPLFDFAVVTYLHKSRQLSPERLRELFPIEELELVGELAGVVAQVPGVSVVAAALSVLDRRLGHGFERYRLRRRLQPDQVEAISRMDHETQLVQHLPRLFAEDLGACIADPGGPGRVALFLDAHDALVGAERGLPDDLYFARDEWLRRLVAAVDPALGVVVVAAGREPPRWSEAPRLPLTDVDLEHVGDLAEADALAYLHLAGIADPALRRRLCDDARVAGDRIHPFSLGLGADLALAAARAGRELTGEDLALGAAAAGRRRVVVDRLLRYVDADTRDAVRAVAVCRSFDADTYRHLGRELGFLATPAAFHALLGFSFVQPAGVGRYRVHDLLRRGDLSAGDGLERRAHEAMEGYYQQRVAIRSAEALAGAIYHANRLEWLRGVREWIQAMESAYRRSDLEVCRALAEVRDELLVESDEARGLASIVSGQYLYRVGRRSEARVRYHAAIGALRRVLVKEPGEPEILDTLGNAHVLLGELEANERATERARENFLAAAGAFDEAIEASSGRQWKYFSNRANALSKLGDVQKSLSDRDAAASNYREAERLIRLALRQAPDEVPLHNNLGLVEMHVADLLAESGLTVDADRLFRSAIRAFDRALQLRVGDPLIHNNRGSALHRRGKMLAKLGRKTRARWCYRSAIAAFEAALRAAPQHLLALFNKGTCCEELGWLILSWEAPPHPAREAKKSFRAGQRVADTAAELAPDEASYHALSKGLRERLVRLEAQ